MYVHIYIYVYVYMYIQGLGFRALRVQVPKNEIGAGVGGVATCVLVAPAHRLAETPQTLNRKLQRRACALWRMGFQGKPFSRGCRQ